MLLRLGLTPIGAPSEWKRSTECICTLHQIAPYIGKLRPSIARYLVKRYTAPGDIVLDCFSGSGTIALESLLLGRNVIASDSNPYAVALTRAKLEAPESLDAAIDILHERLQAAKMRPMPEIEQIPQWVRGFFHPHTLLDALRFADECIERDDQFLLSCLLGILHHQRPGFLSYPSSHLVPYLRDRKFPRSEYPELYGKRDIEPRMVAKVRRMYKVPAQFPSGVWANVGNADVSNLRLECEVDAIVTSPPYMNALDYVRDNRLRMWFLDRTTTNYTPEPTDKLEEFDKIVKAFGDNALSRLRRGGRCVLIVGETVRRKRTTSHPAAIIVDYLRRFDPSLCLEQVIEDEIPDVRRSRRNGAATKRELVLVLSKR